MIHFLKSGSRIVRSPLNFIYLKSSFDNCEYVKFGKCWPARAYDVKKHAVSKFAGAKFLVMYATLSWNGRVKIPTRTISCRKIANISVIPFGSAWNSTPPPPVTTTRSTPVMTLILTTYVQSPVNVSTMIVMSNTLNSATSTSSASTTTNIPKTNTLIITTSTQTQKPVTGTTGISTNTGTFTSSVIGTSDPLTVNRSLTSTYPYVPFYSPIPTPPPPPPPPLAPAMNPPFVLQQDTWFPTWRTIIKNKLSAHNLLNMLKPETHAIAKDQKTDTYRRSLA